MAPEACILSVCVGIVLYAWLLLYADGAIRSPLAMLRAWRARRNVRRRYRGQRRTR